MKKVLIITLLAVALFVGVNALKADEVNLVESAEQMQAAALAQMTAADDTSDVGRVNQLGFNIIVFHLIVSSIDDSSHHFFQGSIDGAESTYTNLNTDGLAYKITTDGCHSYQFNNASGFRFFRHIWISESGGTGEVLSSMISAGREY